MLNQKLFDEFSNKVGEMMANSSAKDIEKNVKTAMTSTFNRLNLITREEFDVQQEVLIKTREALVTLESRLAKLEAAHVATIEVTHAK